MPDLKLYSVDLPDGQSVVCRKAGRRSVQKGEAFLTQAGAESVARAHGADAVVEVKAAAKSARSKSKPKASAPKAKAEPVEAKG